MDNYKLKIQVGKKAFTEILTYKKDELWQGPESEGNELDFEDNDFEEVDSDYEIDFIDGVVSD